MSAAKYTPGPWTVNAEIDHTRAYVRAERWGVVATIGLDPGMPHWDEPQRANARLIAAAPELLEVVRALVKRVRDLEDAGPHGETWQSDELAAEIAAADAAIVKATGSAP